MGKLGFYFWTFYIFRRTYFHLFTKNSFTYELVNLLDEQKEALFFLHKNKFIHSFFFFFPCLFTCNLQSAKCYNVRASYLCTTYLSAFFCRLVYLGIMKIATGQCNANLTKGQEISEAIFFCLQFSQEPRAGILENISFPFGKPRKFF